MVKSDKILINICATLPPTNYQIWKTFCYIQFEIEMPEELRENFPNFSSLLKNKNTGRIIFGPLMKKFADKVGLLI